MFTMNRVDQKEDNLALLAINRFKRMWWRFHDKRQCKHPEFYWVMKDFGMSKAKICKHCDKVLEII
jgi:hypothetical protein